MPLKTNIMPVKTKCSNKYIKPLHIAPALHTRRSALHVCASNVFILNHLLPRNLGKFVANLPDVCARLLVILPDEGDSTDATCQIQKKKH